MRGPVSKADACTAEVTKAFAKIKRPCWLIEFKPYTDELVSLWKLRNSFPGYPS